MDFSDHDGSDDRGTDNNENGKQKPQWSSPLRINGYRYHVKNIKRKR